MWRNSLLSLLLLSVAFPVAAEQLPIWLNEDFFGIARIEDFERRLHQPFPVEEGPFRLVQEGVPDRALASCADFLEANAAGAEWWDVEHPHYQQRLLFNVCYGLKYLKIARPAARSFVREGLFAGFLPDLLPANFATTVSCQSPVYALGREAEWGRLSWRDFDLEILGQEAGNRYELRSSDGDRAVMREFQIYKTIITALARADFDGDGLEDVLLHMENWDLSKYPGTLQERYGPPTEMAILTRETPGGRLRALYSKTGEHCFRVNLKKWKDYAEPWERKKADQFHSPFRFEDLGPPIR